MVAMECTVTLSAAICDARTELKRLAGTNGDYSWAPVAGRLGFHRWPSW